MASIRTRLRSPVAGFAGNATPAAVPATMGCTSTASRLRLGSGGLARRIPSSALARAATRLPQHIWIAIKRRSKSSPTSTDSSLRAIPRSAQCTSSIRIATGSRLHARSISSRAASNIRVRSSRVSPSETGFGTRRPSKSRTKSDRPSTNAASATRGRNASTIGANERSFCSCPAAPSRVRKPLALANRKPSEARRDLPMPPSPESATTCTDPATARRIASSRTASSATRPTNGPDAAMPTTAPTAQARAELRRRAPDGTLREPELIYLD